MNLSASGLPTGVTAGFNPNPTATTSTLTLTVGAGTATGTSAITINGVSGSLSSSTSLKITVTGNGPVIAFNPASLTFANTKVGKTSHAQTVTVSNTGSSTLDISTITTSGPFARKSGPKKTDCGTSLAAGATCTVRVVFKPTQKGTTAGDLTFTDNAAGSPQQVPLGGTGD